MDQKYKTAEIAKIIGIHPNTVRLYEKYQLISKPERAANGYRIFTELDVEQFKLARTLLKVEVLQNGLRKKAVEIIKAAAARDYNAAILLTKKYLLQIRTERQNAEEAIEIVKETLQGHTEQEVLTPVHLTRKQAAEYLHITTDTLRNWELNGLMAIKRRENGYRIYTAEDLMRLKIIRSLRCANYSLTAILRMLSALSKDPCADIKQVIETPGPDDDIITVCDRLQSSLLDAEQNALIVWKQLRNMKNLIK